MRAGSVTRHLDYFMDGRVVTIRDGAVASDECILPVWAGGAAEVIPAAIAERHLRPAAHGCQGGDALWSPAPWATWSTGKEARWRTRE